MSFVDYGAAAEDHCSVLVLVLQLGGGTAQLKQKIFNRIYERISHVSAINISSPQRVLRLRYRREYSLESNAWGEFQYHRRVLGLISVGKFEGDDGMVGLCRIHDEVHLCFNCYLCLMMIFIIQ